VFLIQQRVIYKLCCWYQTFQHSPKNSASLYAFLTLNSKHLCLIPVALEAAALAPGSQFSTLPDADQYTRLNVAKCLEEEFWRILAEELRQLKAPLSI